MNRIDSLRLQGYATDSNGHILCRAGVESRVHDRDGWGLAATPQAERYEQTWLAIVRVDVAHGDARKISDALIVAADSPRALVGKRRDGSAVLVFKSAPPAARPSTSQMVSMPRFANSLEEYGARDGSVRFTLSVASEGVSFDPGDYNWEKNRAPWEFERDRLPSYTLDVGKLVTAAVETSGGTAWSMVEYWKEDAERQAQFSARLASGELKILTPKEEAEAAEEKLVADNEGVNLRHSDGLLPSLILRARAAVAARRKARADMVAP